MQPLALGPSRIRLASNTDRDMYSQATLGAAKIALPRRPRATNAIESGKALVERTLIAFMFCSLVVMVMVLFDASLIHWFVVPVVLSGAIIGSDAVAFLQDRVEVMDPIALIGTLGLHFFFTAPLLHVFWDSWTPYVVGPPEWRDWLGWMAILNLLGLLLYR